MDFYEEMLQKINIQNGEVNSNPISSTTEKPKNPFAKSNPINMNHQSSSTEQTISQIEPVQSGNGDNSSNPAQQAVKEKPDLGTELLKIARELVYVKDKFKNVYCVISDSNCESFAPLDSDEFIGYLKDKFMGKTGKSVSTNIYRSIKEQITTHAIKNSKTRNFINRVSCDGDFLYLNRCTDPISFIRLNIKTGEIDYTHSSPFIPEFHIHQNPLPKVEESPGTAFSGLFNLLSITDEKDQALILSFLIGNMTPNIAVPYIWFIGPPKGGKTTSGKYIKEILDPTNAPTFMPAKRNELAQLLAQQFIPIVDNVEDIQKDYSNLFSGATSGIQVTSRKMYSNDGLHIFEIKTSAIITALKPGRLKDDLLSRIFFIKREPIVGFCKEDNEFREEFKKLHPYLLYELLSLYHQVEEKKKDIKFQTTERCPETFRICRIICDIAFKNPDLVFEIIDRNKSYRNLQDFQGNPVVAAVVHFMKDKDIWSGRISDLMTDIESSRYPMHGMPDKSNVFSRKLKEGKRILEANGVTFIKKSNVSNGAPYEFVNRNYDPDDFDDAE